MGKKKSASIQTAKPECVEKKGIISVFFDNKIVILVITTILTITGTYINWQYTVGQPEVRVNWVFVPANYFDKLESYESVPIEIKTMPDITDEIENSKEKNNVYIGAIVIRSYGQISAENVNVLFKRHYEKNAVILNEDYVVNLKTMNNQSKVILLPVFITEELDKNDYHNKQIKLSDLQSLTKEAPNFTPTYISYINPKNKKILFFDNIIKKEIEPCSQNLVINKKMIESEEPDISGYYIIGQ